VQAVVVAEYGGPEVLGLREVPEPEPGPGEVTIKVSFAAVNFTDVRNRVGDGLGRVPFTPGVEAAGTVRKVGPGVTGLRPGQPVAAFTRGSAYAEVARAPALLTVPLPDGLAGRPASGGLLITVPLALMLLRKVGGVAATDLVLLHSAAGGVGTVAGQLALHAGLRPLIGTAGSAAKAEFARQHGFATVYSYTDFGDRVMADTDGRGVDVVLDPIGGAVRAASFEVLAPFGRLVTYSNVSREPEVAPEAEWLRARCVSYVGYSGGQFSARFPELMRPVLEEAVSLVAQGVLDVGVTQVFPLAEVAAAHRAFETRTARGKLILSV
jgi:NADPH2:quinone reductase